MPYPKIACPKCSRRLKPSGELTVDGQKFPVYQCDECLVTRTLYGETLELPFTFYIDAAGVPVDVTDPDTD
jgi:hypothetical protein